MWNIAKSKDAKVSVINTVNVYVPLWTTVQREITFLFNNSSSTAKHKKNNHKWYNQIEIIRNKLSNQTNNMVKTNHHKAKRKYHRGLTCFLSSITRKWTKTKKTRTIIKKYKILCSQKPKYKEETYNQIFNIINNNFLNIVWKELVNKMKTNLIFIKKLFIVKKNTRAFCFLVCLNLFWMWRKHRIFIIIRTITVFSATFLLITNNENPKIQDTFDKIYQKITFFSSLIIDKTWKEIENTKKDLTWFDKPALAKSQKNNFLLNIDSSSLQKIYQKSPTYKDFYENVRTQYLQVLVKDWFTGFISKPYNTKAQYPMQNSWYNLSYVQPISQSDSLDVLLSQYLQEYKFLYKDLFMDWYHQNVFVTKWWPLFVSDINITAPLNFSGVYLFKNQKDLDNLWYKIVSRRNRKNIDKWYRRHNIHIAFEKIWKVVVLNPGQEFSYLKSIDYDPYKRKNYMIWQSVVGDEIKYEYWGWLCGGSTAIYQWILTNSWFKVLDRRNHSLRVTDLYAANINGEYINFPWLDATIYEWQQDLEFKNQTNHPLVFVMELDNNYGSHEVNMSLGFSWDIWQRDYMWKKIWWNSKCYTWKINWKNQTACYKLRLKPKVEEELKEIFYTWWNI